MFFSIMNRRIFAYLFAIITCVFIVACSEDSDVVDAPSPRLVKVVNNYNVVTFNKKVYGVPHGVPVDWNKDDLTKIPNIIIETSIDRAEIAIKGLSSGDKRSDDASLIAPTPPR